MRKSVNVLLFVIGLAAYLNTGWIIGTYLHNNIAYKSVESGNLFDKFLAGPDHITKPLDTPASQRSSLLHDQAVFSVIWPLFLVLAAITWIIYSVYWLLWLVFAGGIAKLIGVG